MVISTARFQQDKVYEDILTSVSDKNCSQDVLTFLCFSNVAFPYTSGSYMLGEILGYTWTQIAATLRDLNQVTTLPTYKDTDKTLEDVKRPLRILPSDFQDYLTDQTRSGIFYIDPQTAYDQLARTFLMHLPSLSSTARETSLTTILLVSRIFISICTKITHLNEDLWNNLFQLDFDAYLHLLHQCLFPQWDVFEQASRLLNWVKARDDHAIGMLGFTRSLFIQYRESWDRNVGSSLRPLTVDRQASNIITSLQHPFYLSAGPEFYSNMSRIIGDVSVLQHPTQSECAITPTDIWILGGRVSKDSTFLPMLLEYLDDSNRSGDFWNSQVRFLSISETVIKFLFTHEVPPEFKSIEEKQPFIDFFYSIAWKDKLPTTTPATFLYALQCLPIYLDNAAYSNKLAGYLNSHTLDILPTLPEKLYFDQAVTRYQSNENSNIRVDIIPNDEQGQFDDDDDDDPVEASVDATTDYRSSYASSSTWLSTGDYGLHWTRRALSQASDNAVRSDDR